MATTLYVHVPFCVVKCGYCDFNSFADHSGESHDAFLDALDAELAMVQPAQPPSVFVGGGTPTFLAPERFRRLLDSIGRHVDLHACPEVTIEANPESLTLEKAQIAREAGVNRASVGAQTFDARRLRYLDRAHDADATRSAVRALRDAGFTNVSIDMMFGVPGQSVDEWHSDLDAALELEPAHMSCYNLTFEPGTRFRRDLDRGEIEPNDPDVDLEMFDATRERLLARGFTAYEISNFAGSGGPCAHNDHYWLQGNYVGVGPGAAEHFDGTRTTNLKALSAWADHLARGERPIGDRESLSPDRRAGEAVWLGLRRRDGVDLADIATRTGFDAPDRFAPLVDQWCESGHLRTAGSRLVLTNAGIRHADSVSATFITEASN